MPPLTLKQALVRLRNRLMLVEELYDQCVRRSQQTASLNIYTSRPSDHSLANHLEQSQYNCDTGQTRSLEGIPIAFKDNFCTKGTPTTCASLMLKNYRPPYNATMVTRSLDNGALFVGKTNMDEFAMGSGSYDSQFGPVKNPWSLVKSSNCIDEGSQSDNNADSDWLVAGGSSGGSVAAVAAGTCLAAFGTDTGGSVRQPASYCGVVGFKPTYGLMSRHGVIPLCHSMDTPAIVTQTVEDCAIVLNVVAGHDPKDSTTVAESHAPFRLDYDLDLSQLHIGIPKEAYVPFLQDDVLSLWQKAADRFEKAGAKVTQVSLPYFQYSHACYMVLCACDVASNFSCYDGIEFGLRAGKEDSTEELYAGTRLAGLNEVVRGRIMAGNYFLLNRNYEDYFVKAQKIRRKISEDFRKVFASGVDLLLLPTAIGDAPLASWFSQESNQARCSQMDTCVAATNLAGVPSINVPVGFSQKNLPVGLQLMGPMFSESSLLSAAHWLDVESDATRLCLDFLDKEYNGQTLRST